jgi:hypothetical protein
LRQARRRGSIGAPPARAHRGRAMLRPLSALSSTHHRTPRSNNTGRAHLTRALVACRRSPARRNSLVALMRGSIAPRPETTPTASLVEAPAAPKVETPHTSTALRRDSAGRIDGQTLLAGVGSMFSKPGGRSQGSKLGSCKSLLASAMSVRSPSQRGE